MVGVVRTPLGTCRYSLYKGVRSLGRPGYVPEMHYDFIFSS